MYRALGPGWASSILGFVVVLAVPGPYYFQKRGPRLRSRSKYASKSGLDHNQGADEGKEKQAGAITAPNRVHDFIFRHP